MPRRRPQPPLPPRDGLGAARVRLRPGPWPTIVSFLDEITGDPDGIRRRVDDGEIRLTDGTAITLSTPYPSTGSVYLYRDLPHETTVPGEMPVLLRDDDTGLLAVDKPPFLATTPRGKHVAQTALVRLRRELDLPDLSPIHRLDRLTSGVLLFTTRPASRRAYHDMVARGGLAKTYLAIAPLLPDLELPARVHNRLSKPRGSLQTIAAPATDDGPANADTTVELERDLFDGRALYRLTPTTGQTHQLRVHLSGLGIPIEGDPLYPQVREVADGDFSTPLQLLAARVRFTDPVSGQPRDIRSARHLPIRGVEPTTKTSCAQP